MTTDYYLPFVSDCIYHIYNRGNNHDDIFYGDENYAYFLSKFTQYLSPLVDTFAYCLLPNHFHLVVRVKQKSEILPVKSTNTGHAAFPSQKDLDSTEVGDLVSEAFRRFFLSYAKSINKQTNRVGALFQKNVKRKQVTSMNYFTTLVVYVHTNPQLHCFCADFRDWQHSSYHSLLSDRTTKLLRNETLHHFGTKDKFIEQHQNYHKLSARNPYLIED